MAFLKMGWKINKVKRGNVFLGGEKITNNKSEQRHYARVKFCQPGTPSEIERYISVPDGLPSLCPHHRSFNRHRRVRYTLFPRHPAKKMDFDKLTEYQVQRCIYNTRLNSTDIIAFVELLYNLKLIKIIILNAEYIK